MARRRKRTHAALVLACLIRFVGAFPVYVAANGTTVVRAAFGSNLVLSPDVGGTWHYEAGIPTGVPVAPVSAHSKRRNSNAPSLRPPFTLGNVVTRSLLEAQGGVQLNGTLVNEQTLTDLINLAQTQLNMISQLVAVVNSLTNAAQSATAAASSTQICGIIDDPVQCKALTVFAQSTWYKFVLAGMTGWSNGGLVFDGLTSTYCFWPGVMCGGTSGSDVIMFSLYTYLPSGGPYYGWRYSTFSELRGSFWGKFGHIPEELGNCTHLSYLDLSHSGLSSTIPASLGSLTALTYLDFTGNTLLGAIPETLSNLGSLTFLSFANNPGLVGTLPASLVALNISIDISGTNITEVLPPPPGAPPMGHRK